MIVVARHASASHLIEYRGPGIAVALVQLIPPELYKHVIVDTEGAASSSSAGSSSWVNFIQHRLHISLWQVTAHY